MTDDARILERVAGGDRAAFEAFVRRHRDTVRRYARAVAGDDDAAEDAVQEVFIAAWRGAAGFRGGTSARAWLLVIARNAVRRQHRRSAGEPPSFEPLETVALQAGWGRSPDDDWTDRLAAAEVVERGLAALGDDDREILLLRDMEGFTNDEAAEVLGLSLPAVKSRLHRARLRFMANVRGVHGGP